MCYVIRVKNDSHDNKRPPSTDKQYISHKGVTHGHVPAEFGWFGRCFTVICWSMALPYSGGASRCLALTA